MQFCEVSGNLENSNAALGCCVAQISHYTLEPAMRTVERAFELAQSGKFEKVAQIRSQLKHEGWESVDEHLAGPTLRIQLKAICDSALTRSGDD